MTSDGVEIPSDFHGVGYVPLDPGETWKLRLAKEMREAGLKIVPQPAQANSSRFPHSWQNTASAGLSC